jgi:hypothetical protein
MVLFVQSLTIAVPRMIPPRLAVHADFLGTKPEGQPVTRFWEVYYPWLFTDKKKEGLAPRAILWEASPPCHEQA